MDVPDAYRDTPGYVAWEHDRAKAEADGDTELAEALDEIGDTLGYTGATPGDRSMNAAIRHAAGRSSRRAIDVEIFRRRARDASDR